jgi:hypothetical protein
MMALSKLLGLGAVAVGTVTWSDHGGDHLAIVLKSIHIIVLSRMAIHTAYAFLCVGAGLPVDDNAGVGEAVTIHTGLRAGGDNDVRLPESGFFLLSGDLHPLDKDQRQQEQSAQRPNNKSLLR